MVVLTLIVMKTFSSSEIETHTYSLKEIWYNKYFAEIEKM